MKFIRGNRNKSRIGTLLFLLSFLFSLQTLSAKVEGSITTSGVLFQDEVWSGEVHITGDVVIPEGITLTVRAGTTITFMPNSSDNDVGIMTFDLSSPRVTSNRIYNSTLWSISCYNYSFSMISKNIIESSEVGIGCEDSSLPIIQYNTFSNNSVDILTQDDSNPTKLGNIFKNNEVRRDIKG